MVRGKKFNPKIELVKKGIDEYLKQNPMSYVKLAEVLGINYTTTLQVLTGDVSMSHKTCFRIERFLQEQKDRENQKLIE